MANPAVQVANRRKALFGGLEIGALKGLEIGPLDDPLVRRIDGHILYVDHAPRPALVAKYTGNPHVDIDRIVDVDAVWGARPLAEVIGAGTFDYVVASHVAEHVPDLVGWLVEIQTVLKKGGHLLLVLPDKRMSYDCIRRETNAVDVLDAFVRQAKHPQTYQLLDCALGVVQSDAYKMHVGTAAPQDFPHIHTIDSALQLARHALRYDEYIDIHCWSFTPRSFAELMRDLTGYGLVDFACAGIGETDPASNWEFYVKLQTGLTREDAAASWDRAASEALPYIQGSAAAERFALPSEKAVETPPTPVAIPQPPILGQQHLANARIVHDRSAYLPLLPKGGTIVEIGVALGTFSKRMIEICRPAHFIAIDIFQIHRQPFLWGRPTVELFSGRTHAEYYKAEIADDSGHCEVTVMEGDSAVQLELLPDKSVDIFYVDADHSYDACSKELSIIKRKIKETGIICINDYVLVDSVGSGQAYGVIQATNEFMIAEGWEMIYLALQQQMYCDIVIRRIDQAPGLPVAQGDETDADRRAGDDPDNGSPDVARGGRLVQEQGWQPVVRGLGQVDGVLTHDREGSRSEASNSSGIRSDRRASPSIPTT